MAAVARGLKERREYLGYKQSQIARVAQCTPQNVSKMERGEAVHGNRDTVNSVAMALRLRGWKDLEAIGLGELPVDAAFPEAPLGADSDVPEPRQVPVFAWGAAGDPRNVELMPDPIDYIDVPPGRERLLGEDGFAVKVHGNSMVGRGIVDGDVVFVNPGRRHQPGDVVLARVDGKLIVKEYYAGALRSNGVEGPHPVPMEGSTYIIGTVVWKAGGPI